MANGEGDGYGEFGGGGSVHWELKVGEGERPIQVAVDPNDEHTHEKHAYRVRGVDNYKKHDGDPGYFEVSLLESRHGEIYVKHDGRHIKFYFKVNGKGDFKPQVRVDWGESVVVPPREEMVSLSALLERQSRG